MRLIDAFNKWTIKMTVKTCHTKRDAIEKARLNVEKIGDQELIDYAAKALKAVNNQIGAYNKFIENPLPSNIGFVHEGAALGEEVQVAYKQITTRMQELGSPKLF